MNSLDIGAACVDVTAPVLVVKVEVCVCFEGAKDIRSVHTARYMSSRLVNAMHAGICCSCLDGIGQYSDTLRHK